MKTILSGLILAGLASFTARTSEPINGWTEADILAAMDAVQLAEISDNTADARFPSTQGRTPRGFPVSVVRMACSQQEAIEAQSCRGLWITLAVVTTEHHWATKIQGSIERASLPFNPSVGETTGADTPKPLILIDTYLVSDGGVSDRLLVSELSDLLDIANQTAESLLLDDPAHADLWAHQAD
ncbi:hypothetical protein [Maricaulis sp. CAU 1757]